jgi:hypothetical protein
MNAKTDTVVFASLTHARIHLALNRNHYRRRISPIHKQKPHESQPIPTTPRNKPKKPVKKTTI